MAEHNFGENKTEYSRKEGKAVPVWQSPKYKESRDKAVEMIDSGRFGLSDADFWILMNEAKGKMIYTGLIISHNGCLKINASQPDELRYKPECVSVDKTGFGGSLVFTYSSAEQWVYEVGEVSASNCKIAYPYAMGLKRLLDRVVLKLSRLAFSGIYSESEAEEFRAPQKAEEKEAQQEQPKLTKAHYQAFCAACKKSGASMESWTTRFEIKTFSDMTVEQYKTAMSEMTAAIKTAEANNAGNAG